MTRIPIDMSGWQKTNMVPGGKQGEVRVRGGLNLRVSGFTSGSGFVGPKWGRPVAGGQYAIKPQSDDIMRIYAVGVDSSGDTRIQCWDEDFNIKWSDLRVLQQGEPDFATWAVVSGFLFCSSPSFATCYAYQGGAFMVANADDDPDDGFTTLPIPRGICVEWGGRLVIAADDVVYFANPGNPFRFISTNFVDPPGGSIRAMYNLQGMLIICTTNGVYGLPQEAGLRRDVVGSWQRLGDYQCTSYGQTVEQLGIVWGVSSEGLTSVYPQGVSLDINQSDGVRWHGPRMVSENWRRRAKLMRYGDDAVGLVVEEDAAMFVFFPEERFGSWWIMAGASLGRFAGSVNVSDGAVWLFEDRDISSDAYIWSMEGQRNEWEIIDAGLSGDVYFDSPDGSPVLRKMHVSTTASPAADVFLAVSGKPLKTKAGSSRGVIVGTSVWGSGGDTLEEEEMRSRALHTASRRDSHTMEVGIAANLTAGAQGLTIKMTAVAEVRGAGAKRETN